MSTEPPICGHRPRGRLSSGDADKVVIVQVCHRVECIAAAEEWVHEQTGQPVTYVPIDRSKRWWA